MHISCNSARSTIIKLNISGANLNGTLDKFDFSAFPNLKKLMLFQSGLYGNIPEGSLKQLTELQLGGLGLDGVALPEEIDTRYILSFGKAKWLVAVRKSAWRWRHA
ncbi:hypothetical protein ZWY2020_014966 [Hordeum vulgare]|nr:hypothetical protein ZWY2020_014966 [Hordeum vulgare]